jgi:hypothetical protein
MSLDRLRELWWRFKLALHVLRGRPVGYKLELFRDGNTFYIERPNTWLHYCSIQGVYRNATHIDTTAVFVDPPG